jgi:hypothetical protein
MAEASNSVDFKPTMPLIEGFGPPWFRRADGPSEVDFRWEREWRVAGDFSFSLSDVAFGLCRRADKAKFEALVGAQFPFVDLTDEVEAIKHMLRQWPHLRDLR